MKFDERRLPELVRQLAGYRVVLLHGDDPVLIAERARAFADGVAATSKGLFGPAEFDGSDHARVRDALASPVLGGGVRLVRLRNATDAACVSVEMALESSAGALLLIESGPLAARSRLRSLVERSETGASVSCWATDGRDLGAAIDRALGRYGVRISAEARKLLTDRADGYGAALHDAEKAALLLRDRDMIEVSDIVELDQQGQTAILDSFVFMVASGVVSTSDRMLEGLLHDGVAPVALIRALLGHFMRLRTARAALDGGADIEGAISMLRPPVFFRRVVEMRQAVFRWKMEDLNRVCMALWRADLSCRQTGAPGAVICRHAVWDASPGRHDLVQRAALFRG